MNNRGNAFISQTKNNKKKENLTQVFNTYTRKKSIYSNSSVETRNKQTNKQTNSYFPVDLHFRVKIS